MYLHLSNDEAELMEPEVFGSFKIVIGEEKNNISRISELFKYIAVLSEGNTETGWVRPEVLRQLSIVRGNAGWQSSFDDMVAKARAHGWIDPRTGFIKAHIEWHVAPDQEVDKSEALTSFDPDSTGSRN